MKKIILATFLFIVFGISALNYSIYPNKENSKDRTNSSPLKSALINPSEASSRLSKAIQIKTISIASDDQIGQEAFIQFNQFLFENFPLTMRTLSLEYQAGHSLLLRWKSNNNRDPMLFLSHSDVVDAQENTNSSDSKWVYPPFSGQIDDRYIWGRGALDDKPMTLGILEAVESLIKQGYTNPNRDIYIAITHDEEIGGHQGAKKIAAYLNVNGVFLEAIFDEGQAVTDGVIPDIESPVALIGISQKGYLTLKLEVEGEPGHSMMPPKETAISILSAALTQLTNAPMNTEISSPVQQMFKRLSREVSFPKNVILYHSWLTEPLIKLGLEQKPSTDALVRSSMSVNTVQGGIAENVLPKSAHAIVNYRIALHDTSDKIIEHVLKSIDDVRVKVTAVSAIEEPAPITSTDSEAYRTLQKTIEQTFPSAVIAPSITLSTTDSRHFYHLSESILRFSPLFLRNKDLPRIHGINERISIDNYLKVIEFYHSLLQNL